MLPLLAMETVASGSGDGCYFAAGSSGCRAEVFPSMILLVQQHQPSPAMVVKAQLWP
jgi:hypothetical protein